MCGIEIIKDVKQGRFDLSDYLIHFIKQGNKSAFEILTAIVLDGKITCGWASRRTKKTVFGNKKAICFTEMPLYSLYLYVQNRRDINKVDFYGVALDKRKMFDLGTRNVIYGATIENEIEKLKPNGNWINKNINENEQYRYMLTKINDQNDWTHEREWRWTNQFGKSQGDYLPIWKNDTYEEYLGDKNFSQEKPIIIIVRHESEVQNLKILFTSFKDDRIYNQYNINRTIAISLENMEANDRLSFEGMDFNSLLMGGFYTKMFGQ